MGEGREQQPARTQGKEGEREGRTIEGGGGKGGGREGRTMGGGRGREGRTMGGEWRTCVSIFSMEPRSPLSVSWNRAPFSVKSMARLAG